VDADELRAAIRKYAIKNAFDYGKADPGSVLGKIISLAKGMPVPELREMVSDEVSRVNSMGKSAIAKEYEQFSAEFEQKAQETVERTAKPNLAIEGAVDGKVVTRISPGPSGYMHIGHVKQALISEEVARIYKGKFYRYFDDTDPERCKQEYVNAMMKDHEWLGLRFDKTYYASDHVDEMYKYTKQLIESGDAYVCTCAREVMKEKRFNGDECEHRKQHAKDNLKLFNEMLDGKIKEGGATVRFIGDMKSQNTVMRDPVIMRIVETPHYRTGTKYRVWPTYEFNTPIVDSLNGITDIIRSKEYELRDEESKRILGALKLRIPRFHLEARLNIKGNITQKRDLRKLIEEGKLQGWDDPRLMTIMALKRRGITPDAIRNFVLRLGMTKTDSTVPLEMLLAENKRIIDPLAKHLYFVPDPVKLVVRGAGSSKAKMKLHPSNDYGYREYDVKETFYISAEDASDLEEGALLRLKDFMDIKLLKVGKTIEAERSQDPGGKILQWVSEGNFVECTVLVPLPIVDDEDNFNTASLKSVHGYVESYAEKLKEHETVQFERFGYCILDDKKTQFIFISK
jgi:glutamyl-tRNA synthetase